MPDAQLRNGGEAVELAERAVKLPNGAENPALLDTLGACYAEAGRFDDALRTAEGAGALAERGGHADLAAGIRKHAELYRQKQPIRDIPQPAR